MSNSQNDQIKRVTLDAGHGGPDYGATAFGVREKDHVLDLVLLTERYLETHYVVEINLTRRDDTFLKLSDRRELTNKANSDAFVSFHLNAAKRQAAKGFEGFTTPGETRADPLADMILRRMEERFPGRTRRYDMRDGDRDKEAKFAVLWAKCPCVLMEFGFITNLEDKAFLIRPDTMQAHAEIVGEGLAEFLELPRKQAAVSPSPSEPVCEPGPVLVDLDGVLTKKEFFTQQGFWDLLHQANEDHRRVHDLSRGPMLRVTPQDAIPTGWAEIGFRNGKTDPRYRHSNGEKGLFPLPSNWEYWAREKADVAEHDMTPAQNTYAFLRYMVGLKNSSKYGHYFLEIDRYQDMASHNSGVMAAVVHGYGYEPNFKNKVPSVSCLMEIAGTLQLGPLARTLGKFGFKHKRDVIEGRLKNLQAGTRALEEIERDRKN